MANLASFPFQVFSFGLQFQGDSLIMPHLPVLLSGGSRCREGNWHVLLQRGHHRCGRWGPLSSFLPTGKSLERRWKIWKMSLWTFPFPIFPPTLYVCLGDLGVAWALSGVSGADGDGGKWWCHDGQLVGSPSLVGSGSSQWIFTRPSFQCRCVSSWWHLAWKDILKAHGQTNLYLIYIYMEFVTVDQFHEDAAAAWWVAATEDLSTWCFGQGRTISLAGSQLLPSPARTSRQDTQRLRARMAFFPSIN